MTLHPRFRWQRTRDSAARSAIKTVVYRVFSAADTFVLAWLIFGPLMPYFGSAAKAAVAFGLIDLTWNTVFYYLYERLWAHIELWNGRKT